MQLPNILQQLARTNPMLNQIKQMMDMVRTAQDPNAMLNRLAQNNPLLKQAMDIISQHGGDADKAFRTVAEKNGINPEDLMNILR